MANSKNEPGKMPSSDKPAGMESGAGSKISAGTSVSNVGQSPMPHAHDDAKQGASSGSQASKPSSAQGSSSTQGSSKSSGQSSQAQGGSMAGVQQSASKAAEQARDKAGDLYEDATQWAQDAYEGVSDWASSTYGRHSGRMSHMRDRSARRFSNARGGVQSYVSENPMVVGLVGLAAGLLLGALIPRTRRENEFFGEWSDEVRNQGLRYAREAADRGREYVEEAFSGEDPRFSKHDSEFRSNTADRP